MMLERDADAQSDHDDEPGIVFVFDKSLGKRLPERTGAHACSLRGRYPMGIEPGTGCLSTVGWRLKSSSAPRT